MAYPTRLLFATCALVFSTLVQADVVEYIHTDLQGTVVAVTDENGAIIERRTYEPYGLPTTAIADGPGFTGHDMDGETGLIYMQQRYYDPEIGQFLSIDPAATNITTGQNFNRYWYANNNPYTFHDPDGRNAYAWALGLGFIGGAGVETYQQWSAGNGFDLGKIGAAGGKGAIIGVAAVAGGAGAAALASTEVGVVGVAIARLAGGAYSAGGANLVTSPANDVLVSGERRTTNEYIVESGATAVGSIAGSGVTAAVNRTLTTAGASPVVAAAAGELSGEVANNIASSGITPGPSKSTTPKPNRYPEIDEIK